MLKSCTRSNGLCKINCSASNVEWKGSATPISSDENCGEAKGKVTDQQDQSPSTRWAGIAASLLIAVIAIGIGTAQARKKKNQGPPTDLPGHVAWLGKQLYGQSIDDAKPITDKIQKLVVSHLNTWIADRSPNIVQVRHELDNAFAEMQYPAVGTASAFKAPWEGMDLIGAGYTLGWSNIWRVNVLVIYENKNGHSCEVAMTHFVPRTDLHFAILPPSSTGAFRFLAYGWRLGMSSPRLTAILYSFDGKKLESQWKTEDLFAGKLTVNSKTLVIRYLKLSEYIRDTQQGHYPPRHVVTYKITPTGLQLESEQEVPYKQ